MTIPLYKNHNAPESLPQNSNTGLWFDKFCNKWCLDSQKSGLPAWSLEAFVEGHGKDRRDINPKLDWIRTVAGKGVGDEKLLREYSIRIAALARACGGEAFYFKTVSRFTTGLGREHPIENGFVWHPALGAPFLPGSSVKGLVRSWAVTWLETDADSVSRIFGPRDLPAVPPDIGGVIFFDAVPVAPVQLSADVMTPHYGPYYEQGEAPGDWHSPAPIPFLTVSSGQSFLFALAPRTLSDADLADCRAAAGWLESALLELGAGAKTAAGYGRFERDKKKGAEAEKRRDDEERNAQFAKLNPIAREFAEAAFSGKWFQDKNAFSQPGVIEGWLAKLETTPDKDAVCRLRDLVNHHFCGLLANPDKTEGKKSAPVFKDRQRQFARQLNALLNQTP
jgi:CRISPR-associated protein Cmr6